MTEQEPIKTTSLSEMNQEGWFTEAQAEARVQAAQAAAFVVAAEHYPTSKGCYCTEVRMAL